MTYTKFCVSDSYQNVRRLFGEARTLTDINYKVCPSLHKHTLSRSIWPSCSQNVHRGSYNAVQQYINLSLIAWLCPTPEQTLCSPSLQAVVALITLGVYRPPFITYKYPLAGCLATQLHHSTAEEELKESGMYLYIFVFPMVV